MVVFVKQAIPEGNLIFCDGRPPCGRTEPLDFLYPHEAVPVGANDITKRHRQNLLGDARNHLLNHRNTILALTKHGKNSVFPRSLFAASPMSPIRFKHCRYSRRRLLPLANEGGGGVVVLGMREAQGGSQIAATTGDSWTLQPRPHKDCDQSQFNCELAFANHPETNTEHAFVLVPGE